MGNIKDSFDVIVIGSGPGGYVCAVRAAQLGLKVACVESQETLGGTCLNVGCIPSKALLESSHHFTLAKNEFVDHGIQIEGLNLDLKKMLKRKEGVVDSITSGVEYLFKKNKISWLKGLGSCENANEVKVIQDGNASLFSAKSIVIATGSAPIEIPPAKFDHEFIVDSTDALEFSEVPQDLLVIGGGVIGLELGSVWLRLGAKVTVVEAQDKILGETDKGISREMLKILKKQGMEIRLNTMLESSEVKNGKVYTKVRNDKGQIEELVSDKVLISVGRKPVSQNLGLEALGISLDKQGYVDVNQSYQTKVPNIYAIGDVTRGPMLAHKAEEEGIAVAENIAGKSGHVNYEAIASIVYTWPELASIGLSEEQCKEKKLEYKSGKFYFKANGRAKAMNAAEGFVKILADKTSDRLLGVHIIGPMASEMIAEAACAFEFGASAEDIARSVHAHPTLAEVMKEAALDVDKRAIHS